jgi:hypothetical protein
LLLYLGSVSFSSFGFWRAQFGNWGEEFLLALLLPLKKRRWGATGGVVQVEREKVCVQRF